MDNSNGLADRTVKAIVTGLVVGIVTALIVYVISALTPLELDPGFWGVIAGIIAGLYVFVTRKSINL